MLHDDVGAMLFVSPSPQNIQLLSRIVGDLDYDLRAYSSPEIQTLTELDKTYHIVFATCDLPVLILEKLRILPGTRSAKYVLIGGDKSSEQLSDELRQAFKFDLFVQRPIKSSLLSFELQLLLDGERTTSEIKTAEATELEFTEELKKNYIGVLSTRLNALSDVVTNTFNRLEAQRLAHNMRGTSSSFGLAALARAASALEIALDSIVLEPEALRNHLAQIEKAVCKLKERYSAEQISTQNQFAKVNVIALLKNPLNPMDLHTVEESSLNLISAHNTSDFLLLAKETATDAALIDLDFESIDGFEVARALRETEGATEIPIGFISENRNMPMFEMESAHCGGSLLLQRPVSAEEMLSSCHRLVNLNEHGRPRILIVDDDPDFTQLLASTLAAEGMIIQSTTNPLMTEMLLQEFGADMLILDARMPEISGVELCKQLRKSARWVDLPILFLTAEKGVDTRMGAYAAGADDYLSKPLIVPELLTRVKGRLERTKLLNERIDRDALTGLLLRRSFIQRLEAALHDARRRQETCSICLLDIDHFKSINDTYGHGVGDDVLQRLGHTITRRFRASDIRGRWGGEEFILAFPATTVATIKGAMERFLNEFKLLKFETTGAILTGITFSAGIATFPDYGNDVKDLITVADENLYKAKRAGRNRIRSVEE